jgi:hypothetical protein
VVAIQPSSAVRLRGIPIFSQLLRAKHLFLPQLIHRPQYPHAMIPLPAVLVMDTNANPYEALIPPVTLVQSLATTVLPLLATPQASPRNQAGTALPVSGRVETAILHY